MSEAFAECLKKHSKKIPKHMRDTESCREALELVFNQGLLRAAEIAEQRRLAVNPADSIITAIRKEAGK